ncbi:MAG TPA: hypothetical protein VF026_19760 [Ktedonobacteraceae bacterium]
MAENKAKQEGQAQTSETPIYKSDLDELREASQYFIRSLFRTGVHLAMAPMYILPEEPREHFMTAGNEITRGLSSLAHELADNFDRIVDEMREEVEVENPRPSSANSATPRADASRSSVG